MLKYIYITIIFNLVFSVGAASAYTVRDMDMPAVKPRIFTEYSSGGNLHGDVDSLRKLSAQSMEKGDYKAVLKYAQQINEIGVKLKDDAILLSSYILLAHHSLSTADYSSIDLYFEKALELAEKIGNKKAVGNIYSDMGIYAVNVEMDYYKGLYYFTEGLKLAEELGEERMSIVLMSNMAVTYHLRNDPAGLEYALKVYEYGHRTKDRYLIFMGSYISALIYDMLKDYGNARKYIEEAVPLVSEYRDPTGVYDRYATILTALGRDNEAEQYYIKALAFADEGEAISVVNAYLNYGRYLIEKRKYDKAIEVLNTGIRISREKNNPVYRYKLYESVSEARRLMGDYKGALDYYTMFHQESDSAFNIAKERSINQLMIQYESEKKEREIQEAKLEILRGERRLQISILVIVIIFIGLGAIYILYRRKNKNYLTIVKQNHEALNKERWYRERLEKYADALDDKGNGNKYSMSSLTNEKGLKLFTDLDELIKREHLYRKKDLTREGVANMLSTNRTYLSQVINEHTGLSFNYYIHSFRIDEAVRILSDSENDIPLKALAGQLGFSAVSTFYTIFQATTGMSPSKFREKVKTGNA